MTELTNGIFSTSDLNAARKAFVKVANAIFAKEAFVIERSSYIDSLKAVTPYNDYIIWKRAADKKYIERLPPETTYDHIVYSYQERNDLLLDDDFITGIVSGNKYRILVDQISNQDAPQWSVWTATNENVPEGTNDIATAITPNQSDIFNNWSRTSGNFYFESASDIPVGNSTAATSTIEYAAYEATSWTFQDNRLTSTLNSSNLISFISPNELSNFKHTVTVGSTNADDDLIGIVIGFEVVNGVPNTLIASRTQGGFAFGGQPLTWSIESWVGNVRTVLVNGSSTVPAAPGINDGTGGWAHFGNAKIEVTRYGNTIKCRTSQGFSTTLDDATTITYEIPENSPFFGSSRYGYTTFSQPSSFYDNIELIGYSSSFIQSNPSLVFAPEKTYDIAVDTIAERDAIPTPNTGYRVLVNANSETNDFWTVWLWNGSSYELVNYQNYNTSDFFDYVDWYADGYSYLTPPAVTYATTRARDVSFVTNKDKFVKVLDDGSGNWFWCDYIDGAWNVVARQNGTIELSDKLYDSSRVELTGDVSAFANRDGTIELKYIIDILRSEILSIEEQNKLFYDMLHYIHSSQDQVSWAFKTSFLNLIGYNEPLKAVPVQPIDNTQNLIDYITEVKPYRVKVREFSRIVSPDIDNAAVQVMDYDFPSYYDDSTQTYRVLDMNNNKDLVIIQTTEPWKSWYENYTKSGHDIANYTATSWNPTRFMKIGLQFDRIDHLPVVYTESFTYADSITTGANLAALIVDVFVDNEPVNKSLYAFDSNTITFSSGVGDITSNVTIIAHQNITANAAADRVVRFYAGMEETNVAKLTGIDADKIDGGTVEGVTDFTLIDQDDGYDVINANSGFARTNDNPEELVAPSVSDTISINVVKAAATSMPYQKYLEYVMDSATTQSFTYSGDPNLVLVYVDGVRLQPANYNVDYTNKNISITDVSGSMAQVRLIDFTSSIANARSYTYHSNGLYALVSNVQQYPETLIVDVDGKRIIPNDDYTVAGDNLVITNTNLTGSVQVTYFGDYDQAQMATQIYHDANDAIAISTYGPDYTWLSVDGVYHSIFDDLSTLTEAPVAQTNIVVTTFDGLLAYPDSYRLTLTRPAFDLFNNQETGDYDSGGVEEHHYDTGVVPAENENNVLLLSAKNDSFRLVNTTVAAGSLVQPLYGDNTSMFVSNAANIIPPRVVDVQTKTGSFTQQDRPGVVWVNGERIEFTGIMSSNGITELSGLRRGTHNTAIGPERMTKKSFAGNGSTKQFLLPGVNTMTGLTVAVHEALTYSNGVIISNDGYTGFPVLVAKTFAVDYTAAITSSGLQITFKKAPAVNTTVYLIKNYDDPYYEAGSPVYDGLLYTSDQKQT